MSARLAVLVGLGLMVMSGLFVAACSAAGEGSISGECSDEVDNDEDGAIDCEDEGCVGDFDCFGSDDDDDDDDSATDDDDSATDDDDSAADDDDSAADDDDATDDDDSATERGN
jgi:hypothetical protein